MEQLTEDKILEFGYTNPKRLPDGKWAAIKDMMFTTGLFYNLDMAGYERRWCYETHQEALDALNEWDGTGKPSGNWLAEK